MSKLAEIQHHVASMSELREIVGAMRSLAGVRVQEAQRVLPGIRNYADTMAQAIGTALLLLPRMTAESPTHSDHRALVLCVSEHGFVGGFNEHLIEAAFAMIAAGDRLFVLGSRGAALLLERGRELAWSAPMATRVAGVPDSVNHLVGELYRRIARGEVSRVEVMFARYHQGAASTTERQVLLPLDPTALVPLPQRQPPFHNLASQVLLEKLIAEYVFALLTEATVESLASENAARFVAMESAHQNVSRRLVQLGQSVREARQEEITSELLDLITGSEALKQ
jgi:F-type H+-transporting ATPase subunit gamma